MLAAFAGFALISVAVGVYGVVSYLVMQSRRDIGLRIALAAPRNMILWLVVRQALTRVMASLLFASALSMTRRFRLCRRSSLLALIATYVPAWRATQVDPMTVLREE